MTTISARVIKDSVSPDDVRITTLELRYPRAIHPELMTHRVFSRNASSSRAIPVMKLIRDVLADPFIPYSWGRNKPGMQAHEEATGFRRFLAKMVWLAAMYLVVALAWIMAKLGIHKQIVNRMLEPWAHITVVVTSTEWDNFFKLRRHRDAEPHIHVLADVIWIEMSVSEPSPLAPGQWHLPYIETDDVNDATERADFDVSVALSMLKEVSAARCARTSYLTHDGRRSAFDEDIVLCHRLVNADVFHASPFEHQATPDRRVTRPPSIPHGLDYGNDLVWEKPHLHGNLRGWVQNRKELELTFSN